MRNRGRFGCILIGILMMAGQALAYESGEILRLHYRTKEKTHRLPELPAVPAVGQENVKEMDVDGRQVRVRMSMPSQGDLKVEFSADPLEGVVSFGAVLYAGQDEQFCGLMERVVDGSQGKSWEPGIAEALDLRGQKMEMLVKPTISTYCPFYLSSAGYGLFVEGTWPGRFDMASSHYHEVAFEFEGENLVFHIFKEESPLRILRKYMAVAGLPLMPPKWVYEPWRWRDNHTQRDKFWDGTPYSGQFNAEIVEDVLMMDALGIPCSVYWVDRPWAVGDAGYEDFIWDPERMPNAEEMITWLNERDIEFLLWIAPWTLGDMVEEGRAKNYFLPTTAHAERGLVDFTNPEAVEWWQGYLKKVIDDGVAGFKLDRAEEIVPESREIKTHSGMTTREMRNAYPVMYAKAVHDVLKRERGDDFAVMPRAGYTGSWKYAIFWGGDTSGTSWGLRSAIIAVQRASVMGFSTWGSDTGGYWGWGYSHDLICRWLGFSAFCPLMEVGPTWDKGLWNTPWEPSYDEVALATWHLYGVLHQQMSDYIYKYAEVAHKTGEPIVRPMWVQFPDDAECLKWWNEFTLGPDVIACPLWMEGKRFRDVYLPAGEWIDPWDNNKVITGPKTFRVECPDYKTPFYIRKGADIEIGDPNEIYAKGLELARQKPNMADLLKKADMK